MKITFKIHFNTHFGQQLAILGNCDALGNWNPSQAVFMSHIDHGYWVANLELPQRSHYKFTYKYVIFHGEHLEWEEGQNRQFQAKGSLKHVECQDYWRSSCDPRNTLFTAAFAKNIMARKKPKKKAKISHADWVLRLQVYAPRVKKTDHVCVLGSDYTLGNWNPKKALEMDSKNFPLWKVEFSPKKKAQLLEYKFGIRNSISGEITTIEQGANRKLWIPPASEKSLVILTDYSLSYPIGNWKGAGVAVPVFSLRTSSSMGVGEFLDLKKCVDWAKACGMKIIQLLPINDTNRTGSLSDRSPYSAISSSALNPIYMNIQATAKGSRYISQRELEQLRRIFESNPNLDYASVYENKLKILKTLYNEQKEAFMTAKSTQVFFNENKHWLYPYALFRVYSEKYGHTNFKQWKKNAKFRHNLHVLEWNRHLPLIKEIAFWVFIQYHLHIQLQEASLYARQKHVVLKVDIPMDVAKNSVDTWVYPELFNTRVHAGAPPNDDAPQGQSWETATFNWDEMRNNQFAWWKSRLIHLSQYFDFFCVDRIPDFFRTWEVPKEAVHGTLGIYNKTIPYHIDEMREKGLNFDHTRFCKPYIREHILQALLGWRKQGVSEYFFDEIEPGVYNFKNNFDTQKKIQAFFEKRKREKSQDPFDSILENILMDLHDEVLFIQDPGSDSSYFHPRHSLMKTRSFRELDAHSQAVLKEMHADYFNSRQEDFWRLEGLWKLQAVRYATEMLVCGNAAGTIPQCVPAVMDELNILKLCIQRMPSDSQIEFAHPADYPYLSVCTTSSHDMAPIRLWWESDREKAQRFYHSVLGKHGPAPRFAEDWLCKEILAQHLHAPSMWAIFPLQDLLAINHQLRRDHPHEEQVYDPGNPTQQWQYRMHLKLEDLLKAVDFNSDIKELIIQSGRHSNY
ncbi:MAG: hypothetical protein CR997_04365 [Acidobacteria bacterium]|nr:MAG: hypothetical protein CR997_04365 [Acidobacteriota bacterium]